VSIEEEKKIEELKEPVKPISKSKKVVLVKRGDKYYFRAMPSTAEHPTDYQLLARELFGRIGKLSKGKKWRKLLDRPLASYLIEEYMKGKTFGRTKRYPKWMYVLGLVKE
jgi:hypothetical protein